MEIKSTHDVLHWKQMNTERLQSAYDAIEY